MCRSVEIHAAAYCGYLFRFAARLAIMLMTHFCHVLVFLPGDSENISLRSLALSAQFFMAVFVTISAAVFCRLPL